VGLPELITDNLEDYERLAVQLARHPERLQQYRHQLITERSQLPLFNTSVTVRDLESLYLQMWERYCEGLSPAQIYVLQDIPSPILLNPIANLIPMPNYPVEIHQTLDRAAQLGQTGHAYDASELCKQVLAQYPDCVRALHLYGLAMWQEGQSQRA
jgi:hypothetical protein